MMTGDIMDALVGRGRTQINDIDAFANVQYFLFFVFRTGHDDLDVERVLGYRGDQVTDVHLCGLIIDEQHIDVIQKQE